MKKYAKDFLFRGLAFGGFGPIILGIIYAILEGTLENFSLDGWQVLVAILSTYLLAFFQAGAVFCRYRKSVPRYAGQLFRYMVCGKI